MFFIPNTSSAVELKNINKQARKCTTKLRLELSKRHGREIEEYENQHTYFLNAQHLRIHS